MDNVLTQPRPVRSRHRDRRRRSRRVAASSNGTVGADGVLRERRRGQPSGGAGLARPQPLLSDVCAVFEHFGLRVARQRICTATRWAPPRCRCWTSRPPAGGAPAVRRRSPPPFEAQSAHGFAIDDYASLIVSANVSWREVVLVRSAARFLRQAGLGMSPSYLIDTSAAGTPEFAPPSWILQRTVRSGHAPGPGRGRGRCPAGVANTVEATTTVDEDRILRAFASFVSAMSAHQLVPTRR